MDIDGKYKPIPFTPELAVQAAIDMAGEMDEKRTLCNVLKSAYMCSSEDSYNLTAIRALLLEALWMSKRMYDKLEAQAKLDLERDTVPEPEEFMFSVNWNDDFDILRKEHE